MVMAFTAVLLVGCGGKDSGSGADDGKVWDVNVSLSFVEANGDAARDAVKACEERSGGRLKFTTYFSNSLLDIREIPQGFAGGLAEVGNMPLSLYIDQFPLNAVIVSMPFLGYKSTEQALDIFYKLYDEFPEMAQEFADMGMTIIGFYQLPPYQIHMADGSKEYRLPADFRGQRILTSKLESSRVLASVGGAGIDQPIGELYSNLERGVADGVWNMWALLRGMNLLPLLEQHLNFGPTGAYLEYCTFQIRTEFLESLPEDLQQILIEEWGKACVAAAGIELGMAALTFQDAIDKGNLFVDLTDAEVAQWAEAFKDVNDARIAELEAINPVARDIYNRLLELIG